ncbi:DUF4194 domain-containing protein [Pseudoxanthomonas dokdonensis]|uniref:DUF4194 domain-containing protein n=1 Tax=Pseudoxanthomonas dokdonensis TaxID=344882 RepID=A0A0R0CSF7_9GAMM|nr:DUF4194 domain-containing protein [Pseudoxanthomonas dokdonensis]KRG68163.1 hypothetical protein ABB29_14045 [Pseudoxanthomonas dokdonensis]
MKRSWNTLSQNSNGLYAVADFERAAYRLVSEQVLYASDARSRVAYHLIEDYFADFVAALEPLGIRLERNAHYRYVVALPSHGEGVPVTLDETLALLVLRQRYDKAMRQGLIEDHGEVVVELPDLQEAWQSMTGRPLPDIGSLRTLARSLKRWGVGRLVESDDDPQPFHLRVRPAIVDIVGEHWLQRLDQHNRDGGADDASADEPSNAGQDNMEDNDATA